jgi:uncharacterized protein (UPF0332 family)
VATWDDLAEDSLSAAKTLFESGHYRSCATRCYYAAYAALTRRFLDAGLAFGRGWNNPPHEQMARLVRGNLRVADWEKQQIGRCLRRLRVSRENADYRPRIVVDEATAKQCLRDASAILLRLEANDGYRTS